LVANKFRNYTIEFTSLGVRATFEAVKEQFEVVEQVTSLIKVDDFKSRVVEEPGADDITNRRGTTMDTTVGEFRNYLIAGSSSVLG